LDEEDLKIAQPIELVENGSDTLSSGDMLSGDSTFSGDDTLSGDDTFANEDDLVSGALASQIIGAAQEAISKLKTGGDDRLVGSIVGGHYQILSAIGSGGMSRVYKAKHLFLNKEVALKFLAVGRQFDGKAIARFQTEAAAASELQHPSICTTREFGVDENGIPFLVMDYVEGTSLAETLWHEKALHPSRVMDIMIGICRGLEHAHEQGVIHRDIKPANIILTKDRSGSDAVKLVDFGIAKLIRDDESGPDLTQTGEVFGTPKYMSPEQCLGKTVDQRADIYALGCIFYEMFAGKAPFCNESSLQILFSHINDQPQSIADKCGKNVQAILDRCLQKDPARRYQRVSELLTDLEAVKAGEQLVYTKYTPTSVPKILIAAVVVSVTLLFCILAFSSVFSMNQNTLSNRVSWEAAHSRAIEYRTGNKILAAEAALEECLEIAKKGRNESMIALTLKELADVETSLGKTHEAAEHTKALSGNIKANGLPEMFMSFAIILIGVGSVLAITAVLLFGRDTTLAEFFEKRRF